MKHMLKLTKCLLYLGKTDIRKNLYKDTLGLAKAQHTHALVGFKCFPSLGLLLQYTLIESIL